MAFNIGKYAETLKAAAPAGERDIEVITAEIIQLKQDAGSAILGIGDRLIEAKAMLSHGEWLPWLEDRVEFSVRTANNFMRLSREWRNSQALANLGATKALTLLALPPDERETFMAENHLVDGAEKTVIDMTSRELEKAIKERDTARQEAEAARADAQTAEESRAKMESDLKALEAIHRSAREGEAQAREALAKAQAELKELRERPVEVAVEVDQEAVEQARADAVAEMQAKVDAAEKQLKEAETALIMAKKQAWANAAILSRAEKAEAELAEVRRQLDAAARAEKASVVNQNGDLAMFNVLFSQTQEQVNKMHGLRLKIGKDDADKDEGLKAAFIALSDMIRRYAE